MAKKYLEVGKIVGTHGIKGEVRIECWCDSPEFFSMFKTLYYNGGQEKISVKSRPHKSGALCKIKDVDTVEQADLLRGRVLYMDRNDICLDEDVYFVQDLIGCNIVDVETNKKYGVITDVLKTGANDVYEIKDENKKAFYIPVIDDVVIKTDIDRQTVSIKAMKGLFDDED